MGLEPIVFECAVAKVTTMADGSTRVWLDLPEGTIIQAASLMQCQQEQIYLRAVLTPALKPDNTNG